MLQLGVLGLYMTTMARNIVVRKGAEFAKFIFGSFQINVEGFPNPEDGHEPIFTAVSLEDAIKDGN